MKYRKKPIVIEAICWDGQEETLDKIVKWDTEQTFTLGMRESKIIIATLEDDMTCDIGDWIIKGIKGEIYPCKPDIFETTYEAVEQENPNQLTFDKILPERNDNG